ncbi:MAG TPA: OmpA family protein [Polyangiaceae bacterium]|jgi:outer membrane protein OmpA-like peptidoglycan-associated protein
MIFYALAALAVGASAGIFLALRHFTRKRLPVWVAALHGIGGATGFTIVLLIVVWQPDFRLARQALYLLIATVALGSVNLLFHVRGVRHRTSLILMHALCAVSGVGTLLYAAVLPPAASAAQAPNTLAASSAAASQSASAAPAGANPGAESASALPAASAAPSASAAVETPKPAAQSSELSPELQAVLARAITFVNASAELSPESAAQIDAIASALSQHPEVTLLEVQGHADERGDEARNIVLTHTRAQAVIEALAAKGIARQRLHAAGYGSLCPADPACATNDAPAACHDSDHHANDRRVVFVPLRYGKTSFRGQVTCVRGMQLIPAADAQFNVVGH